MRMFQIGQFDISKTLKLYFYVKLEQAFILLLFACFVYLFIFLDFCFAKRNLQEIEKLSLSFKTAIGA